MSNAKRLFYSVVSACKMQGVSRSQSKARVCSRSLSEVAGSSPAGGMDVCVMCACGTVKKKKKEKPGQSGQRRRDKRAKKTKKSREWHTGLCCKDKRQKPGQSGQRRRDKSTENNDDDNNNNKFRRWRGCLFLGSVVRVVRERSLRWADPVSRGVRLWCVLTEYD
jgi:hypothetical protein